MQTPTKLAVVLTLLSSTALAEIPCDYKVNDKIIYEGKIESVKLVSKSVEKVPKVKDIQNCKVSIEARVDGAWYPSKGEYMFGPDMSQMDACTHAEDRAKKGIMIDADFATETSNLSKQQILNQAATAMLAQANQSKQSVLSLLQ